MEIKLRGEMTIADIRQALFEQLHDLETNYSVKFSRGAVRRQSYWDKGLSKLREALAHRFGDVRRPAGGAASGDWQWSVV